MSPGRLEHKASSYGRDRAEEIGEDESETGVLRDREREGEAWEDSDTAGGDGKVVRELDEVSEWEDSIYFDGLDGAVVRLTGLLW